ncbi:MAG TPA: 23S rRNA (uracil(1939)-C(5))-methyltransferase RlmD [Terracidiphilus sp.]|nr:23S rRNA (uracil(1939)-C(5))-methyltransferase RlmD [Terracidiphilus sp.]
MKPRRTHSAGRNRGETRLDQPLSAPQLVEIEKPIYGGAFLARVEGKAVFVPLALPGEQASVRIAQDKRGYATAETEEIVAASAERIAPACSHFGACGGCHYQHAGYATQVAFKQAILRETLERGGVQAPEVISVLAAADSQSWGYRNRIRLAFDAHGNPGYRGRRSHAVVPISECPIAAPVLVRAAQAFTEVARQLWPSLRPTEISLFCNADETALLASVFIAGAAKHSINNFASFAQAMAVRIPALKGIELIAEGRSGDGRTPPSLRTVAQWGEPSLVYRTAGFDYRVDHGAFFQVNRWLVDGLVERVTAGRQGTLAWDLFAGVGLFARKLTTSFTRVVAVESAPTAIAALKENLRGTTGSAVCASTLDFLRKGLRSDRPDLIVVDPPRTGLGAEITTLLAGVAAPALTYVSCDPATLARDLRALIACGYRIESLTLADLFPQTFHLETVVDLRCS